MNFDVHQFMDLETCTICGLKQGNREMQGIAFEKLVFVGSISVIVFGIAFYAILYTFLTEGRYFGKVFIYWFYNMFGTWMFTRHTDAECWLELIEKLNLRGKENILDVGTAIGNLPLTVASKNNHSGYLAGIDWSPRMVFEARKRAKRLSLEERTIFKVADVRKQIPFDDKTFEVVICLGVLDFLREPETVLAELRRVLANGGILVVSLYRSRALSDVWASIEQFQPTLELDWYKKHFSTLGLGNLKLESFRNHQDVLIAQSSALVSELCTKAIRNSTDLTKAHSVSRPIDHVLSSDRLSVDSNTKFSN